MSLWIESHQALGRHPKVFRLAAELGVSRPTAIGHLHYVWWWALDYAPDGDVSRYTPAVLAIAAEWDGDPEMFVGALASAGFIDLEPMRLHDWSDYSGLVLGRRVANRDRQRAWRDRNRDVTVTSVTNNGLQDRTGQDKTRQDKQKNLSPKVSSPTASDWTKRADQILAATAFPLDYQRLAELLAGENKSGKVQVSRVVRGLYEPLLELEQDVDLSADAMRHGLRAAITAGAPNANYVAKAARGYVPGNGKPAGGSSYGALGELYREAQAEADIIDLSPEEHR